MVSYAKLADTIGVEQEVEGMQVPPLCRLKPGWKPTYLFKSPRHVACDENAIDSEGNSPNPESHKPEVKTGHQRYVTLGLLFWGLVLRRQPCDALEDLPKSSCSSPLLPGRKGSPGVAS